MRRFFGDSADDSQTFETLDGGYYFPGHMEKLHDKVSAAEAEKLEKIKTDTKIIDELNPKQGFHIQKLRAYQNAAINFANTRISDVRMWRVHGSIHISGSGLLIYLPLDLLQTLSRLKPVV